MPFVRLFPCDIVKPQRGGATFYRFSQLALDGRMALGARLCWRCMSGDRLRELILLLAIGSAVTIVVFFLALCLVPFETFTPFPFPRSPGLP